MSDNPATPPAPMPQHSLHTAGGPTVLDELLRGAIDIHHHGYPEITFEQRTRLDDADTLLHARNAGMAGVVLKSHMWPTVGRAYLLSKQVQGIAVYGSLTMNPIAGGFSPMAVEAAARQGARVLFFPTWGAAHDQQRGGFSKHLGHLLKRGADLSSFAPMTVTDARGRLKPEVDDCLAVAAEHKLLIGTAHISPAESMAVAAGAKKHGINDVFFQHPDSNSVKATREEIREMAKLGAVIELCALGLLPAYQRISPDWMVEILSEVGPNQCALTSDAFFDWAPPTAEVLRMTAGILLAKGVSVTTLRHILRDTPRRMLGLPAISENAAARRPTESSDYPS